MQGSVCVESVKQQMILHADKQLGQKGVSVGMPAVLIQKDQDSACSLPITFPGH